MGAPSAPLPGQRWIFSLFLNFSRFGEPVVIACCNLYLPCLWWALKLGTLAYVKVKVKIAQSVMSDFLWSHGLGLAGFPVHGILQARVLEWVAVPFSRGSSQPRDQTQVSCIAGCFFTIWAGRPKNTGAGSLSLLQGIFPTQESNQHLLHCRQILYQLSYPGSWCVHTQFYHHLMCSAVLVVCCYILRSYKTAAGKNKHQGFGCSFFWCLWLKVSLEDTAKLSGRW